MTCINALQSITGLVGYWPFEEGIGTTTLDYSGNNNTGTLTNTPTWVAGKFGNGIQFVSASSQYVSVGTTGFPTGANPLTLSTWVYITANPANYYFIVSYGTNSAHAQICIAIKTSAGSSYFDIYDAASDNLLPTALSLNQWNHLVLVYNGTTSVTAYQNNVSQAITLTGNLSILSSGNSCYVGRYAGGLYLDGITDEIRVYNVALTSGQGSQIYNAGICGGGPFTKLYGATGLNTGTGI